MFKFKSMFDHKVVGFDGCIEDIFDIWNFFRTLCVFWYFGNFLSSFNFLTNHERLQKIFKRLFHNFKYYNIYTIVEIFMGQYFDSTTSTVASPFFGNSNVAESSRLEARRSCPCRPIATDSGRPRYACLMAQVDRR